LLVDIALRNQKAMGQSFKPALELLGSPNLPNPDEFFDVKVPD